MAFDGDMRHLTSEQIQELLDQRLSPREEAVVQEHLSACHACQSEVEAWNLLFSDLGSLADLQPGPAFAQEVLQKVPNREPAGDWVRGWLDSRKSRRLDDAHIPPGSIQDYLERLLPTQPAARLEAHLGSCTACRREVQEWEGFLGSFRTMGRFAPTPGFAQRVMAEVRVPAPVPARQWSSVRGRALAWARSILPQTRHGWAVAGGVASTPTITIGALVFLVFSHPLLTAGSFSSYVYWKASAFFSALFSTVTDSVVQSAALSRASSLWGPLAQSPFLLGLGGLLISLLAAGALLVLYKNLIAPSSDDRYARARV